MPKKVQCKYDPTETKHHLVRIICLMRKCVARSKVGKFPDKYRYT